MTFPNKETFWLKCNQLAAPREVCSDANPAVACVVARLSDDVDSCQPSEIVVFCSMRYNVHPAESPVLLQRNKASETEKKGGTTVLHTQCEKTKAKAERARLLVCCEHFFLYTSQLFFSFSVSHRAPTLHECLIQFQIHLKVMRVAFAATSSAQTTSEFIL